MEELSMASTEFAVSYENINYYVYCPRNYPISKRKASQND